VCVALSPCLLMLPKFLESGGTWGRLKVFLLPSHCYGDISRNYRNSDRNKEATFLFCSRVVIILYGAIIILICFVFLKNRDLYSSVYATFV